MNGDVAMRNRWWAAPVLAGGAALLAACGTSTPSTSPSTHPATNSPAATQHSSAAGSVTIETHNTSLGTVLTTAQGRTIYWFAIDTPTTSMCTGQCATFWPPVIGTPTAMGGTSLPHTFGTITRSDGQTQATYNGRPLYTYMGDTATGQTNGNGKNLSGGLWYAMTPSGNKLSSGGSSGGGGGGGYGY
jgi:predicted lipoprotein with Yx(FWY)xxD motif